MRVRLLNNGGYRELNTIDMDTVFEAVKVGSRGNSVSLVEIKGKDLVNAGAGDVMLHGKWSFLKNEYEIVEK